MKLWARIKNVFTDELVELLPELPNPEFSKEGWLVTNDWSVNWDGFGEVVSVERCPGDEECMEHTLIGYFPPMSPYGPTVKEPDEWKLFITRKQHEEVVKDFEAWLDLKEGKHSD